MDLKELLKKTNVIRYCWYGRSGYKYWTIEQIEDSYDRAKWLEKINEYEEVDFYKFANKEFKLLGSFKKGKLSIKRK